MESQRPTLCLHQRRIESSGGNPRGETPNAARPGTRRNHRGQVAGTASAYCDPAGAAVICCVDGTDYQKPCCADGTDFWQSDAQLCATGPFSLSVLSFWLFLVSHRNAHAVSEAKGR